jgi:hypothetical protein
MTVKEKSAANTHDHWAMTPHNSFKSRFFTAADEGFQQLSVGQARPATQKCESAKVLEDRRCFASYHLRPLRAAINVLYLILPAQLDFDTFFSTDYPDLRRVIRWHIDRKHTMGKWIDFPGNGMPENLRLRLGQCVNRPAAFAGLGGWPSLPGSLGGTSRTQPISVRPTRATRGRQGASVRPTDARYCWLIESDPATRICYFGVRFRASESPLMPFDRRVDGRPLGPYDCCIFNGPNTRSRPNVK